MMKNLSFIVPVYNVAPYLRKCVDSLLNQDYNDYEIILVDDGSTDNSGALCDEYASCSFVNSFTHSFVTIRVIHQPNAGLSAARNTGIAAANGEYICFVDSDDYWQPNVLASLMEQVQREQLDVLRFDYQNVRIGKNEEYEIFEPDKTPRYIDKKNEIVDGEKFLNDRMSYACYAWAFILRRECGIRFKEGIYFEDTEWTPRMLVRAIRVNTSPTIVYNYFWRSGSITKEYSEEHIKKKNQSLMQVNFSLKELLPMVDDKRWINGCISDNVFGILNNVSAYDYDSATYWVDLIIKNDMLPLQGYNIRMITLLRYTLINISPWIYCWFRHVRINRLRR